MKIKIQLPLLLTLLLSQSLSADPVESALSDFAACRLIVPFLMANEMPSEPLYRNSTGQCEAITVASDGNYFSDAECQNLITYKSPSIDQYCLESLDTSIFGNGALTEENTWWQHPALSLNIGLERLGRNTIPFETRAVYKSVRSNRGNGTCKLEMRIYKKRIADSGLKPLLMFHGGSWNARQGGMIGVQSQLSHYTDDGFVVFTPFYRLTGENEANEECNGINGDAIVQDANDALDWVLENASSYGGIIGNNRVLVAGQSAGGHLAASLAVHQPDKVARALLFYPPTDFPKVIGDWQSSGIPKNALGVTAVTGFIDEPDVNEIDITSALVQSNDFPSIAASKQGQIPPLYMIHGDADKLVPVTQSARLCNSLAGGDPENGAATNLQIPEDEARKIIQCHSNDSQLHVISGADHILDVCIEIPDVLKAILKETDTQALCPAGTTAASREAARKAIKASREWLTAGASGVTDSSDSGERNPDEVVASNNGFRSSSGGGGFSLPLFLLAFIRYRLSVKIVA